MSYLDLREDFRPRLVFRFGVGLGTKADLSIARGVGGEKQE
jgi:hypothetical protein